MGDRNAAALPSVEVAVSGHRFLAEVPRLRAAAVQALAALRRAFPGRELRLWSALAEGADRLVAAIALQQKDASLRVVLPLPPTDYEQDFADEASRQEFRHLLGRAANVVELPAAASREAAYAAANAYLLGHCAALIALWDGQPAQGQGGTAEVVEEALRRGLPVVHILTGNRKPGTTEPTSLGDDQGRLVFHNLPQ